ncbi:MAG TPA: hypothetical protein VHT73_01740 [Thermodesulfobacteriota bacterium]|nr:hypothetical protein [Thermodesulfobacteriota bacterium]
MSEKAREKPKKEVREMRWMQKKLEVVEGEGFKQPEMPDGDRIIENSYSPKYILRLLAERNCSGKALFYFRNASDYISLSSNGHLNVRGGEEEFFKHWGSSDFRNLKPQSIFRELEDEIIKISFVPGSGERRYSFDSYNDFIDWLVGKQA